jgi:1-phosphofructokinase
MSEVLFLAHLRIVEAASSVCERSLGSSSEATTGQEIGRGLRSEAIPYRAVAIGKPTRANVVVTTDSGVQYRLNPTWPVLDRDEVKQLDQRVRESLTGASMIVISGALVRGAPIGLYAGWVKAAGALGIPVFRDCDGAAFRKAVPARPFLVKPNLHELEQWVGRSLKDLGEREAALRQLTAATRGWVVLSCGEEGAWMLGSPSDALVQVPAKSVRVRNTVGAGDAMLAGIVRSFSRNKLPSEWLRAGIQAAALSIGRAPG